MKLVTREEVVAEAKTWMATPYIRRAWVKGAGCDCFTLLFAVYLWAGFLSKQDADEVDNTVISSDWFCHVEKGDERYMFWLLRHAAKIGEGIGNTTTGCLPGNLALTKCVTSKVYNHGGLITQWPKVLHCTEANGVEEVNAVIDPLWICNQIIVLDPWEKLKAA